jgi:nucleotide-binding universal stress UspA family protein
MGKKIVIGFDGTEQSKDALYLGAAIAKAEDARLIVASAVEFGPLDVPMAMGSYDEAKAEHHERVFEQARAELGSAEFERRELQDSAAHGLTVLAEEEQADLIVVGSTHHGVIGRVLAGAVAERLFHGAPCAVAVAPRGWSWSPEQPLIEVIGVGYDGSAEAKVALGRAGELAEAFGATLRVITIAPYIGPNAEFGRVEELREPWVETVNDGVRSAPATVETERVLRQGRTATELALQGSDADLLVVGSRGYGPVRRVLAGSVASELLFSAPCPVLVVPRSAAVGAPVEPSPEAATA